MKEYIAASNDGSVHHPSKTKKFENQKIVANQHACIMASYLSHHSGVQYTCAIIQRLIIIFLKTISVDYIRKNNMSSTCAIQRLNDNGIS